MSEDVAEVRNHWWWRPGWREGRHIYACHLILDDQPQLRALVPGTRKRSKQLWMSSATRQERSLRSRPYGTMQDPPGS
jgi:hypothetical protein